MKLSKTGNSSNDARGISGSKLNIHRAAVNKSKNSIGIVIIGIATLLLIVFVLRIGSKATSSVSVCMVNTGVYKNQAITEDMLTKYEMITAEYEKYTDKDTDGVQTKRIVTWDNRESIIGKYAAYPILPDTIAFYREFTTSKIDNSDIVMYSYPGKELVSLEMSDSNIDALKVFLQPGDKINIRAIYIEEEKKESTNSYGEVFSDIVEVCKSESVFNGIVLADMLNASGESILDYYTMYNNLTVGQQNYMDNSEKWKEAKTPATLLIALTPEEMDRYNYYLAKSNVQFKISLPQKDK